MIKNEQLMVAWLPKEWLEFFDIREIEELETEWRITLIEREDLIPGELKGKDVVLDGYMNPVEVEDYPLRGKATYLKFIRRRWKEEGSTNDYANHYEFHPEGMKATKEFGLFLKELDREEANQHQYDWTSNGD